MVSYMSPLTVNFGTVGFLHSKFRRSLSNCIIHLPSRCSPRNFKTMAGSPSGSSKTARMGRTATKEDTGKQERRDAGTVALTFSGNLLKHEHPVLAVAEVQAASTDLDTQFINDRALPIFAAEHILLLKKKRGALHEE